MTENAAPSYSGLKRVVREPLIHFLALAAGIFALQFIVGADDREVIVVDQATRDYLIEQREELQLAPLTEEDKERIIDSFVEDEILVREARARGFDDNSRVRALLLQNMRFFLASDVGEPTDEELRAFFEENREKFIGPVTYSFALAQFSEVAEITPDVIAHLNDGGDPNDVATRPVPFGSEPVRTSEREIVAAFGRENAREILDLAPGSEWHGPYISRDGVAAMVKMVSINDRQMPPFETVRNWVATDWLSAETGKVTGAEIDRMRANYRIEFTGNGED